MQALRLFHLSVGIRPAALVRVLMRRRTSNAGYGLENQLSPRGAGPRTYVASAPRLDTV